MQWNCCWNWILRFWCSCNIKSGILLEHRCSRGLFFMIVKVSLQIRSPFPGFFLFFSLYYLVFISYPKSSISFLALPKITPNSPTTQTMSTNTFYWSLPSYSAEVYYICFQVPVDIVFATVFFKLRVALRFTTTSKTGWVGSNQIWSVYLIFRFLGHTFQVEVTS